MPPRFDQTSTTDGLVGRNDIVVLLLEGVELDVRADRLEVGVIERVGDFDRCGAFYSGKFDTIECSLADSSDRVLETLRERFQRL